MRIPLRSRVLLPLVGILVGILVLVPFLFSVTGSSAAPPMPSEFWGTVQVRGQNVPDSTLVEALIGGTAVSDTVTFVSQGVSVYILAVGGADPGSGQEGGVEGDTIQFRIDGELADQTGVWHEGTTVELNLTVENGQNGQIRVKLEPPAEVLAGAGFSVPLVVESGDQVAGIQWGLGFDSDLIQYLSVESGDGMTGCLTSGDAAAEVVQVCTQGKPGSSTRVVMRLMALPNSPPPNQVSTELSLRDLKLFDIDGISLPGSTDSATLIIKLAGLLCGDLDSDSDRDRDDVRKLIDFILHGGFTPEEGERANVAPHLGIDTELNAGDGVVLLRFVEGLIQNINCAPIQ